MFTVKLGWRGGGGGIFVEHLPHLEEKHERQHTHMQTLTQNILKAKCTKYTAPVWSQLS